MNGLFHVYYVQNLVFQFNLFKTVLGDLFFVFFFSVPPQRPVIYNGNRRDRTQLLEAYNEGQDVSLICEVNGGKRGISFIFQLLK